MPNRDIVVIGGSAGSTGPLKAIVSGFAPDLPAAVFVVVHGSGRPESLLPRILGRAGPLPVSQPENSEPVRHGRSYIAPPDLHLVLKNGSIGLSAGPRENLHRPPIDVLFRTASLAFGPRVVGVILSGTLDDGVAGLQLIKSNGGIAIVQDPDDAEFPNMPLTALRYVQVDHRLPVGEIARAITGVVAPPQREAELSL